MSRPIVIVGAGLAGLSAALAAAENGIKAKLVSELPSERAQSVMAEGGINAALNTKGEGDSTEQHFADTIAAACGLAAPNAVRGLVEAAPDIVRRLLSLGVQFNMSGFDDIDLRNFGGQRKKRTAFAQSDTGKQIMAAMIDEVRKYEAKGLVERYSHHAFMTLLLRDSVCCGCAVRDCYTGELVPLDGGAVIVATGGMHGLFGNTTGSLLNTGAAAAELFRLGVPIANAEFIQYHPTTAEHGGKRFLISEAARGEGGRLFVMRGGKPWYFMEEKYPEFGNLMPRDIVSREVWEHGKSAQVFLDMREIPSEVMKKKLSGIIDDCIAYLRIDPQKEPLPISPGIHYFMGGIQVDGRHRTVFPGLYAAGECCCQYHGANRLGGNSLLGAIYGGAIAANSAMDELSDSAKTTMPALPEACALQEALNKLNSVMQSSLGIVRDRETLVAGLAELEGMPGNLPLLGRAVLMSAVRREESRGGHFRSDFPERDDDRFLRATVARFDGSRITVSFEKIQEGR